MVKTLFISTRNAHKVQEIRAMLPKELRCFSIAQLPGVPEVVEDANSFAGNATKKAVEIARWIRTHPQLLEEAGIDWAWEEPSVLADDSGLEVDALQGAPGVHSARFAALDTGLATNTSDAANNAKLLRLLQKVPEAQRTARFRCVIALAPSPIRETVKGNSPVCEADEIELQTELFESVCEGRIALEPRGAGGFGYDPLFIPDGFEQSFAELGEEIKNRISHRARALEKLRNRFFGK